MDNLFTILILHKSHDRREEQLAFLLKSLKNIMCPSYNVVVAGDIPTGKAEGIDCLQVVAANTKEAIRAAILAAEKEDVTISENIIVMSDDMIIANKCSIAQLAMPKRNAKEPSASSHCPFFTSKGIFEDMEDNESDGVDRTGMTAEAYANHFLGIEPKFCFDVDWKHGPLMGNFVSETPRPDVIAELISSRYFLHIKDAAFPALRPYLEKMFPDTADTVTADAAPSADETAGTSAPKADDTLPKELP